jgi:hypothetical protein
MDRNLFACGEKLTLKMKMLMRSAIIMLLTVILMATQACDSTGYKMFNIKEGLQAFNFEYPESYKLIRIDMSDTTDSQFTTIGFGATINGVVSEIYIYVWPTSIGLETASATLDTLLSNASSALSDYNLVNKSTPTVNGQIAEGASFTAIQTDSTIPTSSNPAYYRVTCFVQNNVIVEMDMTCDVSLKDMTQSDYDHLLDTFALIGS